MIVTDWWFSGHVLSFRSSPFLESVYSLLCSWTAFGAPETFVLLLLTFFWKMKLFISLISLITCLWFKFFFCLNKTAWKCTAVGTSVTPMSSIMALILSCFYQKHFLPANNKECIYTFHHGSVMLSSMNNPQAFFPVCHHWLMSSQLREKLLVSSL